MDPNASEPPPDTLNIKLIIADKLFEYQINQHDNIKALKQIICQDLEIHNEEDLTLSYLGVELDNNSSASTYQFMQNVLISASVSGQHSLNNSKKLHRLS